MIANASWRGKPDCGIMNSMNMRSVVALGLSSVRGNLVPMVVLWGAAFVVAVLYYHCELFAAVLEPIADFRTKGWHHEGWGKDAREFRTLCLPSTGHWGDIGYVVFRTSPGRAVAELYQDDYFFPSPPGPGKWSPDVRSPVWDRIVAENRGQTMHWMWDNG